MKEGRGRLEGIMQETAKGQTRGWQTLLPNLERVNAAARRSGQTQFTALLHHVDAAALMRAFKRQPRAASPGVDRVTNRANVRRSWRQGVRPTDASGQESVQGP